MKIDSFIDEVNKIGISIDSNIMKKLDEYSKFLIEYNSHTNLTAIKEEEGIYLKHFFDSILVAKYFDFNKINSLIDVGSGAGFPGIVLKIFYPHLKLTVLDSNNKKTKFISELVEKLNLENVDIVNDRAENYVKSHRHEYDASIARAVSELRIISELCLPLTKVNGYFIAMKGNYEEEYNNSSNTFNLLNSSIEKIYEDELPIEKSRRTFILVKVNKIIDEKYPRTYEQIIKKALK